MDKRAISIEPTTVYDLVHQAVEGTLNVPEFQRGFVWEPQQVRSLAESLCSGYPIGSILLWRAPVPVVPRGVESLPHTLWIVDGQQRITALCILAGRKPYWWKDADDWQERLRRYDVVVRVVPQGPGDEPELRVRNPALTARDGWVSVRRVLQAEADGELTALAEEVAEEAGLREFRQLSAVYDNLSRVRSILAQHVPTIRIHHGPEEVADIFRRLNQEGTRVKEADVTLAVAAAQNPGWVR